MDNCCQGLVALQKRKSVAFERPAFVAPSSKGWVDVLLVLIKMSLLLIPLIDFLSSGSSATTLFGAIPLFCTMSSVI